MIPSPEAFLRARGLDPLVWETVLTRVGERSGPAGEAGFARLHRAFTAYPTEHTCRAFYDLAARYDLHDLLAGYRFDRLRALLEAVDASCGDRLARGGTRVLDIGAGGGYVAAWLRDVRHAVVSATDLSPLTAARLEASGFPPPAPGETFDLVVCADSLGEINADEDDWLSDPAHADHPDYPGELEARYGFASKLAGLTPRLAPGGAVLLFEPVPLEHFWHGAARGLEAAGWRVDRPSPGPAQGLRLVPATQRGVIPPA